ncbi:MAG: pseudouridine synthase [Candidatus Acidiferrales bacterium]
MLERLQKIIARAGVASRRHAEELISSGFVTVNGRVITELGTKADESRDHIKVSGKLLRPESERVYLLLHKPPEVVSTMSDPEGRASLRDFLHGVSERVFPVGRLEYHSSGLVFLTNDGDLANRMLHAHGVSQTYLMKLKTLLTFDEIATLGRMTGAQITRLRGKDAPWYEVTLAEASNDVLRKKLFQTGHPVEKMKRVRIAGLAVESLAPGRHRVLSPAEVSALSRTLANPAAHNAAHAAKPAAKALLHKAPRKPSGPWRPRRGATHPARDESRGVKRSPYDETRGVQQPPRRGRQNSRFRPAAKESR